MMTFGDGTHSRGNPDPAHLTFVQKFKCGEDGENLKVPYTQNANLAKKKKMILALPCKKIAKES
jgi:hypothetical protein